MHASEKWFKASKIDNLDDFSLDEVIIVENADLWGKKFFLVIFWKNHVDEA
jgi:nitrogen fixation protein